MKKITMLLMMFLIFIFASCEKKAFIREEQVDHDLIEDSENIGDTEDTGDGDTGSDDEMPDNDSEYVDPCTPNPCTEENKTVCSDDNNDGVAECGCKEGYVLEENACINSKFVECDQIDVTVPENGVIVVENVEILWSDQGWSTPVKCGWICKENYHSEDGLTCISNTKIVNCAENAPENATDNVVLVEITWDSENGWSDPSDCEWTCNEMYHTEDSSTCTSNFKTVQCNNDFIPPENAEIVAEDVEIIWEDGSWRNIPECGWICKENYHSEDGLTCISNTKTVNCAENAPENATDIVVLVHIIWNGSWSTPENCEWTCNEMYHTEDSSTCTSNFKTVQCNNDFIPPENAEIVAEDVEIIWEDGNWQETPKCGWICNENYHSEDGLTCISNTKTVNCTENAPENATDNVVLVEITWDGSSWSTPENCEWTCNEAYHTEDGSTCTINFKTVQCGNDFIPPENAEIVVEDVEIIWEDGRWQDIPECGWICKENYHSEDGLTCISNTKTVNCTENAPENATDNVVLVEIIWDGSWSTPENCEWTCNEAYHTEDGSTCTINFKTVQCDNDYIPPENAEIVAEDVEIIWEDGNWQDIPECGWICKENYHSEDGLTCISNTKTVNCTENAPENATDIVVSVEITWDAENGWSDPSDCEWTCNSCYVENESQDACESQQIVFVDKSATGNEDGKTWENAKTNLSKAIEESCDSQQIWVAANTYTPTTCPNRPPYSNKELHFTLKNNVAIYGGFNGTETDLDERDVSANETILSGDLYQNDETSGIGENADHVFYHKEQDIDETAILDGFTITGGTGDYGGGIYNYGSTVKPTIRNCTFRDISVREDGAAIYNYSSNPTIINCTFKNNSAKNNGGAIYNKYETPTIVNCIFENNSATKNGGAIYNYYSTPMIVNSIFKSNSANDLGGAVYNYRSNSTMLNCTFKNNSVTGKGGAVHNHSSSPQITGSIFENNSASLSGGAVSNYISNYITTSCIFKNNSAQYGGAVYNDYSDASFSSCTFESNSASRNAGAVYVSKSDITIINSAFKNNYASENAGAIYSSQSGVNVVNSTFFGNYVRGIGGAVFTGRDVNLNLQNTIMWGNTAVLSGNNLYWSKEDGVPFPEIRYSNIGGCGTSGVDWNSNICGTDGGGNIDADPLFIGGTTHPLMISPDSPCKDAGNDSYIGEETDISGNIRNIGIVDMGAYEMPCDTIPENATTEITWEYGNPICDSNWECSRCFTLNGSGDGCVFGGFDNIIFVDKSATGDESGKSWENAETDLNNAVDNACQGQQIWVAAGRYTPTSCPNLVDLECEDDPRKRHFTLKNGVALYGGFAGNETTLEERDVLVNKTILSGDFDENDDETDETTKGENAYHVFFHKELNIDETAVLDGFTIADGNANGDSQYNFGGGIFNYESTVTPTISNCILTNNFAQSRGGAVYNYYSNVAIGGITFYSNSASYGGAVYNEAGNLTVTDSTFDSNSTVNTGGAFYNSLSNPNINNCVFKNNNGYNGGAVYNKTGNIAFINSTFNGNSATEGGGAVYNDENSSTTMTDCTFKNNSAHYGGSIYNYYSSSTTNNCVFENNSAERGGAILSTYSDVDVTNSAFKENSADRGGAIKNHVSDFTGTNCIFEGNSADIAGAILNSSNLSFVSTNCTFKDNLARLGTIFIGTSSTNNNKIRNTIVRGDNALYLYDPTLQISYSNIEGCGTSEVDWNTNCGVDQGGNIDVDPMFIGGDDHPLMISYDSPCRNAGSNDFVKTATDIFGVERIIDETVDMGAYEMPCDVTNPNIVYDYLEEDGYRCE